MVRRLRVNLPIEIMQQRRHPPLLLVFSELLRVSGNAGLHLQRMPPKTLGFREFLQNFERGVAVNHPS